MALNIDELNEMASLAAEVGDEQAELQALEQIEAMGGFGGAVQAQTQPQQPQIDPNILAQAQAKNPQFIPKPEVGVGTFAEPALAIATGAIAEPIAGAAGLIATPFVGAERGAEIVGETQEAITRQPTSAQGQSGQQALGEAVVSGLDAVNQFGRDIGVPEVLLQPVGDVAFEASGGSPIVGAVVSAIPTAIFEFLGLKGIQKLRPGARLLTPEGQPTKLLENTLDKQGLVFNNLKPETKAAIPEIAPKRLIPGGKEIVPVSEKVLVEQIKSGAKDNALATLKVVKDRVVPDAAGIEAVKQGFDEGFVQASKTASRETKAGMKQMLDIVQRVKSNTRLGLDIRPGNVVGDSLSKRIKFIRGNADKARLDLDKMATGKSVTPEQAASRLEAPGLSITPLRGQSVDVSNVTDQLSRSLGKLNIEIIDGPNGVPTPVFKGSQISKNKAAQKAIRESIELLSEGGKPDALRVHNLKRQFDDMIDFKKKSATGLSKTAQGFLKEIRGALNESIRVVNPDYARVNDVLSSSLTALDDFQKAAGTSIDIFGPGSNAIVGQKMRTLMSNNQGRINLENAVNQLNSVAAKQGAKFGDDIKDLAMFANSIEDRFGVAAQTSLKGDLEGVVNRAGQQGVKATVVQEGVGKLAKGAEKLRGINDLNAFRAMSDILSNSGAK